MASIKLTGDTSGVITVSAPAVSGTNTILDTNSDLVSSKLTGTVATARLGSGTASSSTFLAGDQTYKTISSGGLTLISTLSTSGATSYSTGTISFTGYKLVQIWTDIVTHNGSGGNQRLQMTTNGGSASQLGNGDIPAVDTVMSQTTFDLSNGSFLSMMRVNPTISGLPATFTGGAKNPGFTTSTTSIVFNWSAGATFDGGTIRIYGLKQEKIMATTINGSTGVSQIQDDIVTTAKVDDSQITNALMADDAIGIAELSATGTPSATTFLRGDNAWATAGSGAATLISTLNTTSGTELTTGTLDLTTYKTIYVKITNIGQGTDTGSLLQWKNNGGAYQTIFTDPSDTSESGHGYIICRPADIVPNYYLWTSTYGARGRDWNVAVGGGPNYKFTTAMMIVPATTSISFKWSGGQTFNLGQILIYGQTQEQ